MPNISHERMQAMMPCFAMHRREPNVSVAALLRRRMKELAQDVLGRNRVYLDTRYWIFFRDTLLGRPASPLHSKLFDVLSSGVEEGRLICPISETTYFELTRQKDPGLVLASARLMDRLSLGVVIQNTIDRVRTEVRHFLWRTMIDQSLPVAPCEEVWLKVGHVIGTPVIKSGVLDPAEELIAQKSFLDFLWQVTLEEMLNDTRSPPDFRPREIQTAREMTRESKFHDVDLRSFKKLYAAELAGFWDVYEAPIRDALLALFEAANPGAPTPTEDLVAEQVRLYKNALRNVVRLGKAGTSLPTAQVVSGLHAIVRWNRNRGFRPTDTYDFHHAAAAMPYCNVFLTERFLGTVLTDPPLSFGDLFGTRVVSHEQEALEFLST